MPFVDKASNLIDICNKEQITISEYTLRCEIEKSGISREAITGRMENALKIMKESSTYAAENTVSSLSGLTGGDAKKLNDYMKRGKTLCGEFIIKAMARAASSSEVNASMGKIVAAPTAGSCGIIPAVLLTAGEKFSLSDEELVKALFTTSGIGMLIAKNATLSGAEGGCQAECGSASAMAAAAVVEILGGSPEMVFDAAAICIKNVLGLVCDPVAGLVESPCVKRNISGAVNALTTVDLVLSGVKSLIPFDEVVDSMYKVGRQLPCELRETGLGGIAASPTATKLSKHILKK